MNLGLGPRRVYSQAGGWCQFQRRLSYNEEANLRCPAHVLIENRNGLIGDTQSNAGSWQRDRRTDDVT